MVYHNLSLFSLLKMDFEKAYCMYRLNRLQEAEKILKEIADKTSREKDLLAQVVCIIFNLLIVFFHSANKLESSKRIAKIMYSLS